MEKLKRILAIHDISCVGKCSITEALPVISACGIECSILPTSLLSTHTGGFTNYTFLDLSDEMNKIVNHFKSLNLDIDAFYTGYLGNIKQIEDVINYIDLLKNKNSIIFVDPVMADDGKLYKAFDLNYAHKMVDLVKKANVIIPNLTEACLLLDIPYLDKKDWNLDNFKNIVLKLSKLSNNINIVILSGVEIKKGKIGVLGYNKLINEFFYVETDKIDGYFHGTGDLLSSSIISCLMNGLSLDKSCQYSIDFVFNSILKTVEENRDYKYGVSFEKEIFNFLKNIRGVINE